MKIFDFYKNNENIQIAHRGYSSRRPENTLCAFEASFKKAKMVELDVAFTKDEIPVVIHDDTLERTSNIKELYETRVDSHIYEFTLAELKKLDLSSWFFETDPYKSVEKGLVKKEDIQIQRISTLEEVLLFCKSKNLAVNVEIKDFSQSPFHEEAVDIVVELIQKFNMEDDVIISSFQNEYIIEISKKYPKINKALLQEDEHLEDMEKYLTSYNIHAYHCCNEIITKEVVQNLLKHGVYTCVFTVNDKKRKEELFSWGVKAVFTDYLE